MLPMTSLPTFLTGVENAGPLDFGYFFGGADSRVLATRNTI